MHISVVVVEIDISLAGVIVMVVNYTQITCVIEHQLHNYIEFHSHPSPKQHSIPHPNNTHVQMISYVYSMLVLG